MAVEKITFCPKFRAESEVITRCCAPSNSRRNFVYRRTSWSSELKHLTVSKLSLSATVVSDCRSWVARMQANRSQSSSTARVWAYSESTAFELAALSAWFIVRRSPVRYAVTCARTALSAESQRSVLR